MRRGGRRCGPGAGGAAHGKRLRARRASRRGPCRRAAPRGAAGPWHLHAGGRRPLGAQRHAAHGLRCRDAGRGLGHRRGLQVRARGTRRPAAAERLRTLHHGDPAGRPVCTCNGPGAEDHRTRLLGHGVPAGYPHRARGDRGHHRAGAGQVHSGTPVRILLHLRRERTLPVAGRHAARDRRGPDRGHRDEGPAPGSRHALRQGPQAHADPVAGEVRRRGQGSGQGVGARQPGHATPGMDGHHDGGAEVHRQGPQA